MKRGFTLIELLAVIIVISLLVILIVPAVSDVITTSRTRLYNVQIKNIELAAKNWGAENPGMLPREHNDVLTLYLYNLKMGGFIEDEIMNPITNELFPNDMLIEIRRVHNSLVYEVLEDSGTPGGIEDYDELIIFLKGGLNDEIEINSGFAGVGASDIVAYTPAGVKVDSSHVSVEILLGGSPVGHVNDGDLASYQVTYTITYSTYSSVINRTIEIVDTTPPEMIFENPLSITAAQCLAPFDLEADVLVSDNSGSYNLEVSGSLNCTAPSTNIVTYTATDPSNNSTVIDREINVY